MQSSGRTLAIPRSGSQRLALLEGIPNQSELITFAAWQTPEKGIPKRMVVRVDGHIVSPFTDDTRATYGFPCALVLVRYTIGGYVREVLIDAVNQSALVVWAESIDVTAQYDTRRIERLATNYSVLPCLSQIVAASISGCECGDSGAADARWLDVLGNDDEEESIECSMHDVPNGARGVRFLNAVLASDGSIVRTADIATSIVFQANAGASSFIETVNNGVTDQSIINVPVDAKKLLIKFPSGTIASLAYPAWIEWVMSPHTGAYF